MLVWYTDSWFVYLWKPHGIPTTWGSQRCFLDVVASYAHNQTTLGRQIRHQLDVFGRDREYGLVNRLDNDTAGLLYFAKHMDVYTQYHTWQQQGLLTKYYIADAYGIPSFSAVVIDTPLAHHAYANDRMVCASGKFSGPHRGKRHDVSTSVTVLHTNHTQRTSSFLIGIPQGVRHQIRVHMAHLGHPLLGDTLYGPTQQPYDHLHLWSVGLESTDVMLTS